MPAPPIDVLPIMPLTQPVDATVVVPGSKSYTNRALLIAAMAEGHSVLRGALFSDDTRYMSEALRALGLRVEEDEADCRYEVWGAVGTIPSREASLFLGNAGTATRFLTAYVSLGTGEYVVDGGPRMRERPIEPLLDGLRQLGVDAVSVPGNGCPPVRVRAHGIPGGPVRMRGDQSSQYFSALLMVGPLTERGVAIEVEGELVSQPYIDLTADVMRQFGATMSRDEGYRRMYVPGGQRYRAREYDVEPDASNASYFFAAAALTGGRVRVEHLGRDSAQGDLRFVDVLEQMGCAVTRGERFIEVRGPEQLTGVDVDMNAFSDTAITLAAISPFASSPTTIRNIAHTRHQETDRLAAMAQELRRLGVPVEESPDALRIEPATPQPAVLDTYDDHRMAMSFALVGLRAPGIAIRDPACVRKTFPDYFERLEQLRRG